MKNHHSTDEALKKIEDKGGHYNVHPTENGLFEATVIMPDETVLIADAETSAEALKLVSRLWSKLKTASV